MELFISIFENSSPRGSLRWNKINYEILQLSADLQPGPLKPENCLFTTSMDESIAHALPLRETLLKRARVHSLFSRLKTALVRSSLAAICYAKNVLDYPTLSRSVTALLPLPKLHQ